tara:strand:+ start:587 stop:733 length:147 start_codon:yes stop_codon:yes gene_type:complete
MMDSAKTIVVASTGVGIFWVNLPMILQMIISVLTIVYISLKIIKEYRS